MELGLYKGDDLASEIMYHWIQLSNERQNSLDRLNDLRKTVFAPDTTFIEVNNSGFNNTTVTPKLTQIYDNLLAQYVSALFPDESWVTFEGIKDEDRLREAKVETYIRHKLKESSFIVTARELLADWILAGYACSGVKHVNEVTKSLVNPDEDITVYYGSKSIRVSPYDFVIEPRAPSFDESMFIRRRLVPRASLLDHDNGKNLIQYNEETLKQVINIASYAKTTEDNLKDSDLKVDGFTSPQEYFQSGMVEVMEFWGDIYDPNSNTFRRNVTVGVVDRMFILWDQENPMWNGKRPYAFTSWRNRPDNLYGQSPLEQLVGMQFRIDKLENAKADVLDRTLHPTINVFGDIPDQDYDDGPDAINFLGVECKVQYERPDASVLQVDNEMLNYMNIMEEMAGSPKQTAGHRTPGEKTKFEVSLLDSGASKQFVEKTKHFEQTLLKRHLNNFYTLQAMNWKVDDVYRVVDDVTNTIEMLSVSKEDVIRDGNFKLRGAENYAQKNTFLLNLRDGLNSMYMNQRTAAHVDSLAVDKMIEKKLDWEEFGIIKPYAGLTEQVDGQMAMQMHQQQRQQEMGQQLPAPEGEGGQANAGTEPVE